jgi:hypothetical protein
MSDSVTLTVVLRPAGGGDLPPGGATTQNLGDIAPDPQAVERARALFAGRGFELGAFVGNAFSITGSPELAREVFGALPDVGSLPLDRLPAAARGDILAVEAEPPLDFGPGSFS